MHEDQVAAPATDGFVPVIDLSARDTARGRAALAAAIDRACTRSGFFVVVGHGVPRALIDRMFTVTGSFFALPRAEKELVAHRPGVSGFRRSGGSTARSLDQESPPDLCEAFAAHVTGELSAAERGRLGDEWATWTLANAWPANPPDFKEVWQDYLAAMAGLAADLMRLFALALGLDEEFFADKFDHHGSSIAVNYYPPQLEPPLPGQHRRPHEPVDRRPLGLDHAPRREPPGRRHLVPAHHPVLLPPQPRRHDRAAAPGRRPGRPRHTGDRR